ncbi:MAG: hypothetical protein ACRDIV_17635 [Ktedonobacteraceae bacterium]
MSLSTNPPEKQDKLTSPDLRLRDSTTLWGPLQLTVMKHRAGTELGYRAGEEAYQAVAQQYRRDIGLPSTEALHTIMETYFALPRHRPRTITAKITDEWRAMFLLGWTSQVLQVPSSLRAETGLPSSESRAISTARYQQRERTR